MEFTSMLTYCAQLERNNNRPWFHANHKAYENARQDFIDLVELLKYKIIETAGPALSERLPFARAKDMLFRIPKDMRVYKNQPPYNPSFRAYIGTDRHAIWPVGYFLMIAPGNQSHFGTGGWCPDRKLLQKARQYIAENFDRFQSVVETCGYLVQGEKLKRVPVGYDPLNPAGEYLKHKEEWFVSEIFPDETLTTFDDFAERIGRIVTKMEPFRRFFDDAFAEKIHSPWEEDFEP